MRIAKRSTIAATEATLAEVEAFDAPLVLPSNLLHTGIGAEAALVQAILTWARRSSAKVETWADSEEQATELVRKLPGLVAGLSGHAIEDSKGHDRTAAVRAVAIERLDLLQGIRPQDAYRGQTVEVVCADHLGLGTPYLLYTPDPRGGHRLRTRENFRSLAAWLLTRILRRTYRAHFDAQADEALGAMLYEVFKNTEEHALHDHAGDLLPLSVRVLSAKHHSSSPDDFDRITQGFGPLQSYCRSLEPPSGGTHAHLFELSVIDAGPGFASSWTRTSTETLTLKEEEKAVRDCFGVGSTKGAERFGQGLPHVLRLLERQKGFLRLRTGRLSFFVDFASENPMDGRSLQRHDPPDGQGWSLVAGSLLTLLVPMRRP
ncbi:hypothetical protein D3C73_288550 [compost metagenome]